MSDSGWGAMVAAASSTRLTTAGSAVMVAAAPTPQSPRRLDPGTGLQDLAFTVT